MKNKYIFLSFFAYLILFSCRKSSENVNFHHDYFPLIKGKFVEYKVTKIQHGDYAISGHDTCIYYLKTVVGDTIMDDEGRVARKFYNYLFDEVTQKYKVKDLWSLLIENEKAEIIEENQRIIKLVFSPSLYKFWDKNSFNDAEDVYIYYRDVHKPYTVHDLSFDSTITVIEDLQSNAFHYYNKYEVYSKEVGLIKKHYQDYSIPLNDTLKPLVGYELFYEVINYGIE